MSVHGVGWTVVLEDRFEEAFVCIGMMIKVACECKV